MSAPLAIQLYGGTMLGNSISCQIYKIIYYLQRWVQEIDWMALNGINFPLAFVGQEAVWRNVYLKLGVTDAELLDFFTGPAFLPWQRMGNVNAWGGGLTLNWLEARSQLQTRIP